MINEVKTKIFIDKAILIHGDKYDYSKVDYISRHIGVKVICRTHGEFIQKPCDHLSGCGCKECGRESIAVKNSLSFEDFVKKANEVHECKYTYNKDSFINFRNKIDIICQFHGTFSQRVNAHIGGQGCPLCGRERTTASSLFDVKDFINKAKEAHGDKYDYSDVIYKRNLEKVTINCKKHGPFTQTPNNHTHKKAGCPACNASKGELALEEIFIKHGIHFKREFKIPNTNFRYEYDFYLPYQNCLIEFHGIQHYKPIEYFGGIENLKYVQANDDFKKHLAFCNNIKIIYFNYIQLKQLSKEQFENLVLNSI